MITALIDGDFTAWIVGYGNGDYAHRCQRYIDRLSQAVGADRAILCFSDSGQRYFRHDLWPTYKSKPKSPPSDGVIECREILRRDFNIRQLPGLEADDIQGILATHSAVNGEKVIVADDKDLQTVSGRHFNPRTKKHFEVSESESRWFHLYQTLVGDTNDCYPGCPGIGPKKALKLLGDDPSWGCIVAAYENIGQSEADAIVQARLARILQAEDYDLPNRRVIHWTPAVEGVRA